MKTDKDSERLIASGVIRNIENTLIYLRQGLSCRHAGIYLCRNMAAVALIIAAMGLAGCTTTARINQFKDFSTVGVAYTNALDPLLTSAGEAAVDANSLILENEFPAIINNNSKSRSDNLKEQDDLLRQRLATLNDIRLHARLLRSYFQALGALAESDAAEGIATGTSDIVKQLGIISPKIKAAKIGKASVAEFISPVVTIAVKNFQLAALDRELAARSAVIERELELHSAALKAITLTMKEDLEYQSIKKMSKEVYTPYTEKKSLPADWAKKRKENLTSAQSVEAADKAAKAAEDLKKAFISIVEGKLTLSDLPAIINDINAILDLVELAKKGSK
jgi:hypothetical protein